MTTPRRRTQWWATVLLLATTAIVALGLGIWGLLTPHPVPVADQPGSRQAVLDAARTNVAQILTYHYPTATEEIGVATEVTTGEFRKYYEEFTTGTVLPTVQKKGVSTDATVVDVGVISLGEDRASLLVFVDQITTSFEKPEPAKATSAVRMTMLRERGTWRISEFAPL